MLLPPDPPTAHGPRNLVVLRAGDGSLHRGWLDGPRRHFDLFISYYGPQPGRHAHDGEYYEARKGPKWPGLADLFEAHPALLERYDAVWLPDDDIDASTDTLNRMFALFHGFGLALAQPALTPDSPCAWKGLRQQPDTVLRYTGFVEVMVPLFASEALRACLPSFRDSASGWGLDALWPRLCTAGRGRAVAVIDATPVRHTRPPGGELYRNHPELDPRADERRVLRKYGLPPTRLLAEYGLPQEAVRLAAPGPWQRLRARLRRFNAQRRFRHG